MRPSWLKRRLTTPPGPPAPLGEVEQDHCACAYPDENPKEGENSDAHHRQEDEQEKQASHEQEAIALQPGPKCGASGRGARLFGHAPSVDPALEIVAPIRDMRHFAVQADALDLPHATDRRRFGRDRGLLSRAHLSEES